MKSLEVVRSLSKPAMCEGKEGTADDKSVRRDGILSDEEERAETRVFEQIWGGQG
jgi:hypothetical protein